MMPVLPPNTLILARRSKKLREGDIVVFLHDDKEKVKRISELNTYELFVVGDHDDASTDSRHFGWVAKDTVIGKVFLPRKLARADAG